MDDKTPGLRLQVDEEMLVALGKADPRRQEAFLRYLEEEMRRRRQQGGYESDLEEERQAEAFVEVRGRWEERGRERGGRQEADGCSAWVAKEQRNGGRTGTGGSLRG